MRPFIIGSLSAAAIYLTVGPVGAQPGDEIVINLVKFDKDRFAFARPKEKPDQPISVRVNQVATWTNQTGVAFALVSVKKGSDGKPLFVADVPKKGKVSVRFTEKMFSDAGGRVGGRVNVDYYCKNLPKTRGVIVLDRPMTPFDKHIEDGLKFGKDRKWSEGWNALDNAEKFAQEEKNAPAQGHAALQQALHIKRWMASLEVTASEKSKLKEKEIGAYQRATQNLPPDTYEWDLARNNLGKIYLDSGNYPAALAQFSAIKKPSSNNAHVLYTNIGQAHEGNEDLNNAYKYYLMAIGQRPSAEIAARKAFSLLTRKNGLPAQRSKELFDMVLRPGSPLLPVAGAEIPKYVAAQKEGLDIAPLLQYYLVAAVNKEQFEKKELDNLKPLALDKRGRPFVDGLTRVYDGKTLIDRKQPLFRSERDVTDAIPDWQPYLADDKTRLAFSKLLGQTADQFYVKSYRFKEPDVRADAARNAVALASASYSLDPRSSESALLLASVLRAHHQQLEPRGALAAEFAGSLADPKNALYAVAKAEADKQGGLPKRTPGLRNLYATHLVLAEIFAADANWGDEKKPPTALGQMSQASMVERVYMKARPNPALQLRLAEAYAKAAKKAPAEFYALNSAERLIDAGIPLEAEALAKIQSVLDGADAKKKNRLQDLVQVGKNVHGLKLIWREPLPDAPIAATTDDGFPDLWIMTSKELRAYNKKDGKFLGGQVKWWSDDMRTRQFSPTGGWLATEKKNEVELGKAKMDVVRLGPGLTSQVQSLAFSHDGKRLAACDNSAIRIWETSTKKPVRTLDAPGGKETRHRMALSADGKLLAFARGPQITLWSVQSGEKLATLEGHRSEVRALAFRADGAMLASGDMGGEMRLWDPANGKPAETILYPALTGIRHMSFSPDAKVLLVTSEGDLYAPNGSVVQMDDTPAFLRLINVASGREYARYRLQNPNVPPIFDGNTLILVGPDPAKLKAGEVSQWSLP